VTNLRIGQGYDIHPFAKGRKLILGGVEVPSDTGLAGHSDADALSHAICDALLGALALGDMGVHFPDTDPKYRNRSSLYFLEETLNLITQKGWKISNVDATIVTQEPRLRPHIDSMRKTLAKTLNTEIDQISVKATRPEQLGALGRKEGLLALATVLLNR
jgi:2-C-methyl-D-erythritol 2,4-cyclodiphosphate synthase